MTVVTHRRLVTPRCRRAALRPLWLAIAAAIAAPAHGADDLTSLSLDELMEVVIVGASKYEQKQSEVAAAVRVITCQEIRAFGWRTLAEALASLPGVHTRYDRQYSYIGRRGFGLPGDYNTRALVTIDGNRVNPPQADTGPSGRELPIDIDLIERIGCVPGPGGAVYGQNAMFGVVNRITRPCASPPRAWRRGPRHWRSKPWPATACRAFTSAGRWWPS